MMIILVILDALIPASTIDTPYSDDPTLVSKVEIDVPFVVEQAIDVYHDQPYKNRRWSFPSHNFTVSVVWAPFLTNVNTTEVGFEHAYRKALNSTLKFISEANHKPYTFRTTAPDHFENGEWYTGS
ncbi:TRICHOME BIREFRINGENCE-LIKE 25 [Perilla frutescens var. hirtella]|uniref:TRICHOME BIREFRINGENCE-LIKE 25 n=1 Tax=Perilla frutescens var. hirtella TaxID=608512 RepID=A0AAD4JG78_PERFH|nr:TRICHOME BIREFRINGENCE-LIKE 25 [Perilla frutescens var. hirtella]